MKKAYVGLMLLMAGALAWQGCRKDPLDHLNNDESRIYITQFDSSAVFTSYKTFSVADSVAIIRNGEPVRKELDSTDALFIQAVQSNMQQRGYQMVTPKDNPDLALNVTRVKSSNTVVSYWGDYGSYWDPYYWGYGGYSYYFPNYYSVYQFNETALEVDMFDLKNAGASKDTLTNVWSGLIRGEDIFNSSNVSSEVGILFNQSAYLKAN